MLGKLAGAALIIASTSYVGWRIAGRYARRPVELRDLQIALAILQTEVEYATPLPDALTNAARVASPGVAALFLRTAQRIRAGDAVTPADALAATVADTGDQTALTQEDLEVLLALGAVLGSSGRLDQMRHLELAQERLGASEARALEERTRYERVARYMGVLSGAALVLILL